MAPKQEPKRRDSNKRGSTQETSVIAVGIFAENPLPLDTTNGRSGLIKGGGWYLLGIQCLTALCLLTWGIISTTALLWLINQVITIRMDVHVELLGADLTEHLVKHGHVNIVGVSRALSAFRPVLDTSGVENLRDVGLNPGHDKHLDMVKILARKKKYKLSRIIKDITKNHNLGINMVKNLFPKNPKKKIALLSSSKSRVEKIKSKFRSSSIGTGNVKTSHIAWIN